MEHIEQTKRAAPQPAAGARSPDGMPRWLTLAFLAAVLSMHYFYVDALLEISKLPALIVFILAYGQFPPG